ncbi:MULTISPECIES: heavy metal-binding domain-containing protein [Rhizobium]|uniref:Heavy metal-binding domain-containing protein n=1 Tax=Rhizobium paranaense TaxID=1650438 RepID=A0A7W9D1U5_9HYPH|nr:heavy metal-binding domain-containing protein [Rhizobium paranaense]MBB5574667.1 hypothetical protein [Rhizobium paranaense]
MGLFDFFKKPDPEVVARHQAAAERQADIRRAIGHNSVPEMTRKRLDGIQARTLPWLATLTPAELLVMRSHGIRPISSVSATCWLHYGFSWTTGHMQGWNSALRRLSEEAKAAGANAVIDVKMRTVPLRIEQSMDFTLVGTAVKVDGLPPSGAPIISTVSALEFAKLLDADIIPVGIAVGAAYERRTDWSGRTRLTFMGNIECLDLSRLWGEVRTRAMSELRNSAQRQHGSVLAHVNFSQSFKIERDKQPPDFLFRHIIIGTVVDIAAEVATKAMKDRGLDTGIVVDMHAGRTPLNGRVLHHQSYGSHEKGEI